MFSDLIYCNLAWGSCSKNCINTSAYSSEKSSQTNHKPELQGSCKPSIKKLKTLTIFDIHKLEIAKYMFKTIQHHPGTIPSSFSPLASLHNYSTRNSQTNFFIKRSNTELGKKCKQVIGARVLSEVPWNMKSLPFPMFVKKFKEYLAHKYEE